MFAQRAGVCVAFGAALDLTGVGFLQRHSLLVNTSLCGHTPLHEVLRLHSPCRHVFAGVWLDRWSCWRPSDTRGVDTRRVSRPCGSSDGFSGSPSGKTPSDSPQTWVKVKNTRKNSLDVSHSGLHDTDRPEGVSVFLHNWPVYVSFTSSHYCALIGNELGQCRTHSNLASSRVPFHAPSAYSVQSSLE